MEEEPAKSEIYEQFSAFFFSSKSEKAYFKFLIMFL